MRIVLSICFLLTLFSISGIEAQTIRKKTERNYRFMAGGDSVLLSDRVYEYDTQKRLIKKHEFFYNLQPLGTVNKEVTATFDSSKMLLDEHIYTHTANGIDHERLKTKYQVYAQFEMDSKYIWRQYYDKSEEIMREDTLTYDKAGNLIKRMEYVYSGSTSQSSDVYTYNKKNQRLRWRHYMHWTTVNIRSKPVTKQEQQQDYRYKYNSKGKAVKVKGKRYSTKYSELYTYDENGKISSFVQRDYVKKKLAKPKTKKTDKKKVTKPTVAATSKKTAEQIADSIKLSRFRITEDSLIRKYKDGYLVLERQVKNGVEWRRIEISYYKDALQKTYAEYQKGIKVKEIENFYTENNKVQKKLSSVHDNNGKVRSVIQSFYNEKEQLVEENYTVNADVLKKTIFEYDEQGQIISSTLFMKNKSDNNNKFEKNLYFYEYH